MDDRISDFVTEIRNRISQVVVGKGVVVERLMVSLFTGDHILLQ
tara:strand:+ start:513 stop:644 length:132 start_codon:yes stop_codon:yes gene_type:complete